MVPDFKKMMADAGLPVNETVAKQQWDQVLSEQQIIVENGSPFSPFWRTVKALITLPVVGLLDWIARILMPDLFIMTASRSALIGLHGPSRNVFVVDAIKAKGMLTLTRTNSDGVLSIPAGALVSSASIGGTVYQLSITRPSVFEEGESVIEVLAEATAAGQGHNLPVGSYNQLVNPVEGVSIQNKHDWLLIPGANEESTEAYRNRIRNVFGTAAKWHINTVYKSIISDFAIPVDNIEIINHAPRGPGTANAFIYLNVGQVSTGLLKVINQHISDDGHHGHGDDFQVYAMPMQDKVITATYSLHANSADIKADIKTFIQAAFRLNDAYQPTRTRPNSSFSMSQLQAQLHNQFPALRSIEFDCGDIRTGLWLPALTDLVVKNG
ncbi:putative bacteriophage protein [Moritella sp. JT01]|uniref:baseplate J/gp47 family protein n=1 Tax=Moritella sp. JT01 TaxID=756698 RepID=UPI000791C012|nr:baseplate J/gp47 family protein [Moritella sp. JT01]KXO08266.1 putative bacteriophage protein [Moritella sp. JT01]